MEGDAGLMSMGQGTNDQGQMTNDIIERARKIKMLILDCDGVLTDGRILITADGDEMKSFDVKDGHAIVMFHRAGFRSAIISGRKSAVVQKRVKELGIHHLHEMAWVKTEPYEAILAEEGLTDEAVCYVGDDVVDIPLLRRAGLAVAVADAVDEVKAFSDFVTERQGGRGAVREVIELILKAQDKWDELMSRYTQ
jgi:3-deoxy-D-manno-octulosonate 8-phosphate phosphatase (KDO 8-P phosphatase)